MVGLEIEKRSTAIHRLRTLSITAFVAVLAFSFPCSSQAKSYEQPDATFLSFSCGFLSKKQKPDPSCSFYVLGVVDTYFLYNPNCQIPPEATPGKIDNQVLTIVESALSNMGDTELQKQSVALLVWQSVAKLYPCKIPESVAAPDKIDCQGPLAILTNGLADNYTKQAALEILRNRGCLK